MKKISGNLIFKKNLQNNMTIRKYICQRNTNGLVLEEDTAKKLIQVYEYVVNSYFASVFNASLYMSMFSSCKTKFFKDIF